MSRLLYRLSYAAVMSDCPPGGGGNRHTRAPIRNRTVDLLLTMETLCRLSYWGERGRHYTVHRPIVKSGSAVQYGRWTGGERAVGTWSRAPQQPLCLAADRRHRYDYCLLRVSPRPGP